MMGMTIADAKALTFHEYTALMAEWARRHPDKDKPVDAPDADKVRRNLERLNGGAK